MWAYPQGTQSAPTNRNRQIRILVIGFVQQTRRSGEHPCPLWVLFATHTKYASFASANDSNAGIMAAVPDLPPANCPPVEDRTSTARPYGSFETLRPQLGAAFSCQAE